MGKRGWSPPAFHLSALFEFADIWMIGGGGGPSVALMEAMFTALAMLSPGTRHRSVAIRVGARYARCTGAAGTA
jgi:hypothetical protein